MTPFRKVLLFAFASLLGLLTIPYLSLDFIPAQESFTFTVSYSLPNKPPLVVEKEVTSILENHLSQLEELKSIYSVSNYGSGYIELTFSKKADIQYKEMELLALLRQVKSLLPTEVPFPNVYRRSSESKEKSAILIYELRYTGDATAANNWLNEYLLPRLNALDKIDQVTSSGTRRFAWKVSFDQSKLKQLGLTANQLLQRIREVTGQHEIGLTTSGDQSIPIRYHFELTSGKDLEAINIQDGIELKDVAAVKFVENMTRSYLRINAKDAMFLSLFPHQGINRIQGAKEIKQSIQSIAAELPYGYELALNYDDTIFLKKELSKTWIRAGLSLLVISLLILVSVRNYKYLILLISSILVSLSLVSGLAYLLQINIHLYTLAGLTISAGILVDNSIVLIDHLKKQSNLSVLPAQLAASLTSIASLLVIFILPDEYRRDLSEFAAIISLTLTVSFFVSWWFTPALGNLTGLLDKEKNEVRSIRSLRRTANINLFYNRLLYFLAGKKWAVIILLVLLFGTPIFLLPSKWENREWYNKTIGNEYYQENIRHYVDKFTGGSLRMFYRDVYENSGYRTPEKTRLYLSARLSYGHTLRQMNGIMKKAEAYLLTFDGIEKFVTSVNSPRYALIRIEFDESTENGSFPYKLKNRLIQRSIDWGGVTWAVYGVGRGFSNAASGSLPNFRVLIRGYHYDKLGILAESLAKKLLLHKRIQEVNTNAELSWDQKSFTRYQFTPASQGQPFHSYASTLEKLSWEAEQSFPALYVNFKDNDFPVYLEASTASDLSIYSTLNFGNDKIALRNFGELHKVKTVNAVHKEERQYIRGVNFDYYGSYRFGSKYLKTVIEEVNSEIPPGFSIELSEGSWAKGKEKRKYELLILLGIVIYFISAIFLEHFRHALYIVLVIPLSFIGLFLTFSLGGFYFDQGGYAAFLMIGGLSVNAIIFISGDFINFRKHMPHNIALLKAVRQKAWAIILTVLSTCVGLTPFLMHGDKEIFWFSLAIGSIGGLMFSLVVVFIFLPVLMLENKLV